MTSQRTSKMAVSDGQEKLLKMVNDQRARCKLTSLESVMNQTGFSWVESMIQHAKDTYQDHISNAVSEAEMNVNILRSPKKDKQKQSKKTTSLKKASPFKKSRIPKASTPPRKSPKKVASSSRHLSPSSPAPTPSILQENPSSQNKLLMQLLPAVNTASEASLEEKRKSKTKSSSPLSLVAPPAKSTTTAETKNLTSASKEQEIVVKEQVKKEVDRKRKSQEAHDEAVKKSKDNEDRKNESIQRESQQESIAAGPSVQMEAEQPRESIQVIAIDDTKNEDEDLMAAEKGTEVKLAEVVDKTEEATMSELGEEIDKEEEEEEEEVSRVIMSDVEDLHDEDERRDEENGAEKRAATVEMKEKTQMSKVQEEPMKVMPVEPSKKAAEAKQPELQAADSIDDSLSSVDTKSLRSDEIFSEGEVEPAPSSSSATSAPKPSLRERIDRFRAIFSPAPRPASSIPRYSPPKLQSPPRPLAGNLPKPPPSQLLHSSVPKSPPKTNSKSAALVPALKPAAPIPAPTQVPTVKVAPISVVVPNSVKSAPPPIPTVKAAAPTLSVKVVAPAPVKLTTQSKTIKISQQPASASAAAPPIIIANPFQKAQLQQQQAALATTSTLRAKEQPPPSTAHIELEEPDSAYSDSEDEETVKRRQQQKPWETKEGLAKALEEQATIDADAIFGIPHGIVPIDDILPPETEHARAKRARPRSSSATWSRDGLKQIEIDRYNARMGIEGLGVRLPGTTQDDGSGTPSRSNRLSAIAQSAINQGQVSRNPSQSGSRASVSPLRPVAGSIRPGAASSQGKYSHLTAGTPKPKAMATAGVSASLQKTKTTKTMTNGGSASQSSKQGVTKSTAKNPFQNGSSSTLQAGRLANVGSKAVAASELRKKS